jgi:hypothetical protein
MSEEIKRPRCKGTCGDAECEEMEIKWRVVNFLQPLFSEKEIFSEEKPYVPIVIIESPYAGDVENNLAYLRAAIHDSLMRGEAPFASHGLYTQGLDDTIPEERERGIQAGFRFREASDYTVVYEDLGISPGMQMGIEDSYKKNIPVKYRQLGWKQ